MAMTKTQDALQRLAEAVIAKLQIMQDRIDAANARADAAEAALAQADLDTASALDAKTNELEASEGIG